MTTQIYNKLIRDQIPAFFAAPNKIFNTRTLTDQEFKAALRQKLLEESQEVIEAKDKPDLINEMADIQEVLNFIKLSENITDDEIENCRLHKNEERGSFKQKLFLESVEQK